MYVCMYVCMYVRMYVCMYVCMYVYIYLYMYICFIYFNGDDVDDGCICSYDPYGNSDDGDCDDARTLFLIAPQCH